MIRKNEYIPQTVPHPGVDLGEKLEELGMGPKEFAIRTDKPEKTISAILTGVSSITPEMAVKFENVLKIPAHFWLNRQYSYDESIAREKQREELNEAITWARNFPVPDLIKKQWIRPCETWEEKAKELLSYFAVSNPTAWEKYYLESKLKLAFRISLMTTKDPFSISAWLRKGETEANSISCPKYSESNFKVELNNVKKIMALHPPDFFEQLKSSCQKAGVKVIITPCLPGCPVSGATRWIKDTPIIQLSGRYRRNDIFWFSFFHEAGHILCHGKKEIFLENVEYDGNDLEKEKEADDFAVSWTFTKEQEAEVLKNERLNEDLIRKYAEKFETHPAMIVGRLHHKKLIPHNVGNELIVPIKF